MTRIATRSRCRSPTGLTARSTTRRRASCCGLRPRIRSARTPSSCGCRTARGGTDVEGFTVGVVRRNENPRITSEAPAAAKYQTPYRYQVVAEDPNGDALAYEVDAVSLGRGVTIDAGGLLTWTPQGVGPVSIGVRVSDGRGGEATQRFDLDVAEPAANTPPRIVSTINGPIFAGEAFAYQLVAEDIEDGTSPNASLVFGLDEAATQAGMRLDPFTGLLTWTPSARGTYAATVTVTDSGGLSSAQRLTLPVNVRPVTNQPPRFSTSPTGPAVADRAWTYAAAGDGPRRRRRHRHPR